MKKPEIQIGLHVNSQKCNLNQKISKKAYLGYMPIPDKYLAEFEENGVYHIYNRTNNKEILFLSDENRVFFLKRYKDLLFPFADTYCWNLLPNHFHMLIKIKSVQLIGVYLQSIPKKSLTLTEKQFLERYDNDHNGNSITLSELIENAFKRFFQSYALAFNKQNNRQGNLFYKPFKRVRIADEAQFTMAVIYIHANAGKHGLVKDFTTYKWSSWHSIISNNPTSLLRDEIIEWFGGKEQCIKIHKEMAAYYYNCAISIEE
jgi:REP element-mobilizing transposase RayT